jgi:Kae1-associated kinase Bud32
MQNQKIIQQGAEAIIILDKKKNYIIKKRIKKNYRILDIDEKIRKLRTRSEAKILIKLYNLIKVPKVLKSNEKTKEIILEFINGKKLSEYLDNFSLKKQEQILMQIGESIAKIHDINIIHGDLTTSNMILKEEKQKKEIYFIDFGLSFQNGKYEDKAVDIHLLKQALEAKHYKNWELLYKKFLKGYKKSENFEKTLNQLKKVEKRGRYRH